MAQFDLNGTEAQTIVVSKQKKSTVATGKVARTPQAMKGKQYSPEQAELNYSKVTLDTILKFQPHSFYSIKEIYLKSQIYNGAPVYSVTNPKQQLDKKLTDIMIGMCKGMKDPETGIPKPFHVYMQQGFPDVFAAGASTYEPQWGLGIGNWMMLTGMKHLEWQTMRFSPSDAEHIKTYSKYLKGITYNPTFSEVEYWQTQENTQILIPQILHIKDPASPDLAGIPMCIPLIGLLDLLDFYLKVMKMKGSRIGAPSVLVKMLNDDDDTVSDATTITQNWGSVFQFAYGNNLDITTLDVKDNQTIEGQVELIISIIDRLWNPATQLDKSGTLIGGSDKGGMVLLNSMINDIIDWLSLGYSVVLQQWLDYNGFIGYIANVQLPHVEIDATELNIEKCRAGYETQALALSERRKLLGHEETDDATAQAIKDEFSAVTPPTGIFQNATPITQDKTLNTDMASCGVMETDMNANAVRYESDIKRILGIKK
jgi:hypothetical protein